MTARSSVTLPALWTAEAYASLTDLASLIETSAERHADEVYVDPVEPGRAKLTFAEVATFVRGLDAFLEAQGVAPGEPCAVVANNGTSLLLLFLGVMAADRAFVPINPNSSADDITYILGDCGARAVLYDAALEEKVSFLSEGFGLVPFQDDGSLVAEMLERGARRAARRGTPTGDSVAEIVYTTGTTGRPKGVRLTHRNLLADMFGIGQVFGFAPGDRFLTITPLFHNSGQITTSLIPLYCGGVTTAVRPDMGFINFWYYVDRFEPAWTLVMPSHVALMLDRKGGPRARTLRGILCGGAKLEARTQLEFEERFGVPIYPNYGLTESSSIATLARPDDAARANGSVGRPLDINEVRVFVNDREAEPNEVGEIRIRGDNVFTGYVNLPEVYAGKVRRGWLHTGDLGFADAHGQIHIVDRVDNMVLVGGENVYPSEIERFVPELAGVREAFAMSIPDRIMGRELVLVYRTADGAEAAPKAWKDHLYRKLVSFKVPRRFVDVRELGLEDFPRAPNGKLLRRQLQTALEARLCPEAAAPAAPPPSRVQREIADALAAVLDVDASGVHDALHMDLVPAWDSMAHLRLMLELEDRFGVTLTPGQMASMTSVREIRRVLAEEHRVADA